MAFLASNASGANLFSVWLNKRFIPALERDLVAQKFTTKAIIPPGMAQTGRLLTFTNAPGTSSSLTEGTIGNPVDITVTASHVTIAEEGEFMNLSRLEEYAMAKGSREEIAKRFEHGAAVRIDSLVLTQFAAATTNIMYFTNTSQNGALTEGTFPGTPTAANAAGLIAARKRIRDGYAKGFTGISGHPENHYAAIIGEQAALDIIVETTTGRMTWANAVVNVPGRMGQEKWVSGYMGSIYGTACYNTQNVSRATYSATNSSHLFVTGDGAVGAMAFEDMNPQVFINSPSANSTDNPYRNFSSVAWHAYFGTILHQDVRMVKMYASGN